VIDDKMTPLTKEEEAIFRELRRKKDREYAKLRRDKTRVRKYGERKTRLEEKL
jgi:hypothetical protein